LGIILGTIVADFTTLQIDAIVNTANESLLPGSGVCGAIHRAAGPECRLPGDCVPGNAKLTKGYRLPARYVIHTVGPVWGSGRQGEAELLASCYRRSFEVAATTANASPAFPGIITGIY